MGFLYLMPATVYPPLRTRPLLHTFFVTPWYLAGHFTKKTSDFHQKTQSTPFKNST